MNPNSSNLENGRALLSDAAINPTAPKAAYETPRLITHGSLRDLTLQTFDCSVSPQPIECGGA